jgi:anti-anti-sigma factor
VQADTTLGAEPAPFMPAVIEAHRHALHGPGVTVRWDSGGVQLTGEADLGCGGLVEPVLRHAAEVGVPAKVTVVDVSELDFLDVAGFRALMAGTGKWRGRGGTLVLAGAHRNVRRVIDIIGGGDRGDVILR